MYNALAMICDSIGIRLLLWPTAHNWPGLAFRELGMLYYGREDGNMSITCLLFFLDSERCSVRFFFSKNALSLTIAVSMGMCWCHCKNITQLWLNFHRIFVLQDLFLAYSESHSSASFNYGDDWWPHQNASDCKGDICFFQLIKNESNCES